MTTPDLAKLIDRADGRRPSALAAGRKRRIVVRLDPPELERLDDAAAQLVADVGVIADERDAIAREVELDD